MPVYIGVDDLKDTATNEQLEQGYIVAESDVRLRILYTFLKKNKSKKIMVFFSSCMSVKFHYEVITLHIQRYFSIAIVINICPSLKQREIYLASKISTGGHYYL